MDAIGEAGTVVDEDEDAEAAKGKVAIKDEGIASSSMGTLSFLSLAILVL